MTIEITEIVLDEVIDTVSGTKEECDAYLFDNYHDSELYDFEEVTDGSDRPYEPKHPKTLYGQVFLNEAEIAQS